ncbi:hypothetical protein Syun_007683 [Stephania yunnanensis]|uniref:Uncharacterized protein n=1 Tax=Stephania yunnanensis TaxID=152371 RepID=A0AAP0L0L9_9MAGN
MKKASSRESELISKDQYQQLLKNCILVFLFIMFEAYQHGHFLTMGSRHLFCFYADGM